MNENQKKETSLKSKKQPSECGKCPKDEKKAQSISYAQWRRNSIKFKKRKLKASVEVGT